MFTGKITFRNLILNFDIDHQGQGRLSRDPSLQTPDWYIDSFYFMAMIKETLDL